MKYPAQLFTVLVLSIVLFFSTQYTEAAIAYRASSTGNNAGGATTLTISKPTSPNTVVAGDVMIAVISVRGGTSTTISTVPSGWTLINSNDSTTVLKSATYYKIAGASETGPYVWGWATAQKASGVISVYGGVDQAVPIMAQDSQVNASSPTMTAPSVTTTEAGAVVVAAYSSGVDFSSAPTAGSSMTLRGYDMSTSNGATSRTGSALQDGVQSVAGASGTKTMTQPTSAANIGHTIALKPASIVSQSGYRWFENADATSSTFAKSWGGTGDDSASALVLDAFGNIYVAGSTDSTGLTAGGYDQTLVKYDSAGVEQWSKTWGGTGSDEAYALALDSAGNIYVAGYTISTGLTSGSYDQTLVKYNSAGVEQWSKTWGGTGYDYAYALALDSAGNIYVAGYTNSPGLTAGDKDQTLVKYNSAGVEQWSKTWGDIGTDSATALALDTSGNIYVAGYTQSTGLTAGSNDQTLVKYDSSGALQWSKTWGGTSGDTAYALALDTSGNIYVAGYTSSTGLTAGGYDQTLVKYNSAGVEQWSKTWGGTGYDSAADLALDPAGNIYVAGYTSSTGLTAGGYDQTLLKFDTTGSIDNCSYCVDHTVTEVDRTTTEVDRTTTEVDRTVTEVDRTTTEVDRTGVATITVVCAPTIDVGAPLNSVAQNTTTTAPAEQQIFRLRTLLHVAEGSAIAGNTFRLQYAAMSGTCDVSFTGETYADVTTSTPIAYANNTVGTDGMGLTANANDPTHSGHANILQEYNEANPTDVTATIPAGQDGLWDFALKDNGAPANTSYCFRIVKSDGSLLDTYSVIPQITTQVPTFEQSGYRWFENQDATGGVATFAKTYSSSSSVSFRKTARDASGNMYVAGGIKDDLFSNSDMLLIKYDASGIEQWSRRWGFAGSSVLLTVGVDGLGNIYVAGITNAGSSANDYQSLIKFNSSGDLLWNVFWGADGNDAAYDLAFDASNNIYVVGAYITGGSTQQSVSKFTPSGTNSWDRIWGGDSTDIARGVALDSSGNIYVVGETASTGLTAGSVDQTLVKYDSSGTLQWSKTWGGDGDDRANGVALDSSGNIYVVGETASTGFTVGSSDQTLVKYNPSGIEQWSKTWGGDGSDQANTLALDSSGNIYVVGETNSSGLTGGGDDQTLVKYSSSGVEQWSKTWGGSTPDSAGSVVVDGVGGIYVVGYNNILSGVGTLLRLNVSGEIPGCSYCVDRTVSEVDRAVAEVDRPSATATELLDTLWVPAPKIPTNISGTITTTVLCENVGSSISTSVPLNAVAQNTATTAPSSGTIFRLRTLLHGANKPVGSAYGPLKLQYAAMSGTCDAGFSGETYADVTASTAIAYADNPVATDGLALAAGPNDPSHSGHTNVLQEYNEANNTGVLTTIPVGQDGLWDFALKDNGGTAGTSYCLRIVKSDNTLLNAYSFIPQITIAVSGTLSIGFVDGSGTPVATPTFSLGAINRLGTFQTTTGTFGDATRKLRVFNSLATNGWSVTLAPTGGATAAWNRTDNLAKYDYNDSGTNATDSAIDADSLGGQMSINPSAGTIASTCSLTGLSKGASGSYVEGTTNSLTLMSATSAAAMSCNWDFTGAPFTQTIPAAQSSGTYTMDMTATVVSL